MFLVLVFCSDSVIKDYFKLCFSPRCFHLQLPRTTALPLQLQSWLFQTKTVKKFSCSETDNRPRRQKHNLKYENYFLYYSHLYHCSFHLL